MTEEFSLPPPKGVEVRPDGFIQALDEVYGQLKAAHEREIQAQHQNDLVHIQLQLSQLHEAHERLRQAKPKKRKPKTNAQRGCQEDSARTLGRQEDSARRLASLSGAHLEELKKAPADQSENEGVLEVLKKFTSQISQAAKGEAPSIEDLVAHPAFQILCSAIIVFNCLRIAFYTDWLIKNSYAPLEGLQKGATNFAWDAPFAVWFCLEVILKIYAVRPGIFFCGVDKYWNIFDSMLAVESALSIVTRLQSARFSALRVLGIFRVARLVKHMDMLQGLRRMRAVFIALSTSVHDFASAAVVVGVVLFAYSVFLSIAAVNYFENMERLNATHPLSAEELQEVAAVIDTFGSLPNMLVSLWAAISGGNDWMSYGDLLKKMDPTHVFFWTFVCFTAFSVVGLLNVVTGVFVDRAVSAADACRSEDEVTASQRAEEEEEEKTLMNALQKMDQDGDSAITRKELGEHLKERNHQALWSHLGITPKQVKMTFELLDRCDGLTGTNKIDRLLHFTRSLSKQLERLL
ncbi:unnamed protein product [Effrenium voratum]|nr:unnamed protein product [Effrenium voratum]